MSTSGILNSACAGPAGEQCIRSYCFFSCNFPPLVKVTLIHSEKYILFSVYFKDGEVHDGSELIGPAEPLVDSLTDSLSTCSSEGWLSLLTFCNLVPFF